MIYLERGLAWSENGEGRGPRIAFLRVTHGCLLPYSVHINISTSLKRFNSMVFCQAARPISSEDTRACRRPFKNPDCAK